MGNTGEPHRKLIIGLSIAVPVLIALLFSVKIEGYDFSFLPPIYASINGATAVLLLLGFWAVKNKKVTLHRGIMKACLALSAVFLAMYVIYHMTSESTPYGGQGALRHIYFFVLITHILLSIAVVPLVLVTLSRALAGNFEKHKALARFAFPIWLYVAITGVIVYLMISPYYR